MMSPANGMPEDAPFGGSAFGGSKSASSLEQRQDSRVSLQASPSEGLLPDAAAFVKEREPEPISGYLMSDFDDREQEHQQYLHDFFQKEPCVYSHRVFKFAAQVYQAVKHERMKSQQQRSKKGKDNAVDFPNIEFQDANQKRLTFGLVFSTLKCKHSTFILSLFLFVSSFLHRLAKRLENRTEIIELIMHFAFSEINLNANVVYLCIIRQPPPLMRCQFNMTLTTIKVDIFTHIPVLSDTVCVMLFLFGCTQFTSSDLPLRNIGSRFRHLTRRWKWFLFCHACFIHVIL